LREIFHAEFAAVSQIAMLRYAKNFVELKNHSLSAFAFTLRPLREIFHAEFAEVSQSSQRIYLNFKTALSVCTGSFAGKDSSNEHIK
jgi:hypothetical protein